MGRFGFDPADAERLRAHLESPSPDGRPWHKVNEERWLAHLKHKAAARTAELKALGYKEEDCKIQVYQAEIDQANRELPEAGRILARDIVNKTGMWWEPARWLYEQAQNRTSLSTVILVIGRPGWGVTCGLSLLGLLMAMGGANVRYCARYRVGWAQSDQRAEDLARSDVLLLDEIQRIRHERPEVREAVRRCLRRRLKTEGVTALGATGDVSDFIEAFDADVYHRIPERNRLLGPSVARREP
jgi:hypothetical protein